MLRVRASQPPYALCCTGYEVLGYTEFPVLSKADSFMCIITFYGYKYITSAIFNKDAETVMSMWHVGRQDEPGTYA